MRTLENRYEIANEINVKRTTVVRIDLADSDEYGLKSQKVVINNGTFRDGTPYMIHSQIRAYSDEMKFVFTGECCCITSSFGYTDIEEMVEYANAPVIEPDSDVVIVVVNSKTKEAYKPVVMHTSKKVSPHCTTPLTFDEEDNNALAYFAMHHDKELVNKWCADRARRIARGTEC